MQNKFQISNSKLQINTNKLREILKKTREDVEERKRRISLDVILSEAKDLRDSSAEFTLSVSNVPQNDNFSKSLRMTNNMVAIIAEVKFASPTEPYLGSPEELSSRVREYEEAGADAISIVTEKHYFQGDPLHVQKIKQTVSLPVLQKDFIIDPYQIYEVANGGADAILLIAKILSKNELIAFVELAKKLNIEPVVEINDEEDLKKALAASNAVDIIAVNARDLDSFIVDVDRAYKLLKKIPSKYVRLGFSGISNRTKVEMYKNAGADGVLVGTSLMKAKNIKKFLLSLRGETMKQSAKKKIATGFLNPRDDNGVKVKICGIRTLEAAMVAVDAGVDFLGFIFVPGTKRYIEPKTAKKIIEILRSAQNDNKNRTVKIVGVFRDAPVEQVNVVVKDLGLDYVELEGLETPEYCAKVKSKIMKGFGVDNTLHVQDILDEIKKFTVAYVLLDRKQQGQGSLVDFSIAKTVAEHYDVFFAGGLTPENVTLAVQEVKPFGVDVSSGVETNRKQDLEKIRRFIEKSKRIE